MLHLLSTPLLQSVGVALGRLRSSDLRPLERLPIHGQVELASIANIVIDCAGEAGAASRSPPPGQLLPLVRSATLRSGATSVLDSGKVGFCCQATRKPGQPGASAAAPAEPMTTTTVRGLAPSPKAQTAGPPLSTGADSPGASDRGAPLPRGHQPALSPGDRCPDQQGWRDGTPQGTPADHRLHGQCCRRRNDG